MVWGAWGASFAIAEYIALRGGHPDAPLSAHLKYVLGTEGKAHRTVGQAALGYGLLWIVTHLYGEVVSND